MITTTETPTGSFVGIKLFVNEFKCLWSLFSAVSQQQSDIQSRITAGIKRYGQLPHLFDSPVLGPWLKIWLYAMVMIFLLTYGCESWTLSKIQESSEAIERSQQLLPAAHTGHSVRQEERIRIKSYDLIRHIRIMWFQMYDLDSFIGLWMIWINKLVLRKAVEFQTHTILVDTWVSIYLFEHLLITSNHSNLFNLYWLRVTCAYSYTKCKWFPLDTTDNMLMYSDYGMTEC